MFAIASFVILITIPANFGVKIPEPPLMRNSKNMEPIIYESVCKPLPGDKLIENAMLNNFTCGILVNNSDYTGAAQSVKFLEQQCNCLKLGGPKWAHCRFLEQSGAISAQCYDVKLERTLNTCPRMANGTLDLSATSLEAHKRENFIFTFGIYLKDKLVETITISYNASRRLLDFWFLVRDLFGGKLGRINHALFTRFAANGTGLGKPDSTIFMDGASCDGCNGALVTTICTGDHLDCKPNELWFMFSQGFFDRKPTEFAGEVIEKLQNLGMVTDENGKQISALDYVSNYQSSSMESCPKST